MHSVVIKIMNFAHNEDILFQSTAHAPVSQCNTKNYFDFSQVENPKNVTIPLFYQKDSDNEETR